MANTDKTVSHIKSSSKSGGGTPRKPPTLQFMVSAQQQGFTNAELSQFSDVNPASIIRELVQNSLDAAFERKGVDVAEVRFVVEETDNSIIPGMDEYKAALNSAMESHKGSGRQTDNVATSLQEAANQKKSSTLFIIDNGIGFDEKKLSSIYGNGISNKKDERSAGAYGNGHLTTFALSGLRYVFYGGVNKGKSIFGGHAIIASHAGKIASHDKKRLLGKDGYFVSGLNAEGLFEEDLYVFPDPKHIPLNFVGDKIKDIREEWGSGSVVAVPAFNHFERAPEDVMNLIINSVAINFFVAIYSGILRITVNIHGNERVISRDELEDVLDSCKDRKQSTGKGFPSGMTAWNSYQTLLRGEDETVNTPQGNVKLLIRKDAGGKEVALCRNGMWITKDIPKMNRRHFANKEPFDALLLVGKDSGEKIYESFKVAEGPEHINIKTSKARMGTAEARTEFEECLSLIGEKIKKLIPDKQGGSFDSDLVTFADGEVINQSQSADSASGKEVQPIRRGRKIHAGKKGKGKTSSSRSGNVLPVKISSKRRDSGTVVVRFESMKECDNVEFQMSVDKGADATCTGGLEKEDWEKIYLKSVKIDGKEIPYNCFSMENDKRIGVYIGAVGSGERRDLEIEYESPRPTLGDHAINCLFIRRKKLLSATNGGQ